MDKTTVEYFIPIQSAEYVAEVNARYKETFGDDALQYKSTDEHVDILIDKLLDAVSEVGDAGGWYRHDGIKVKIEVEYVPEDK
jgi:hypothetical protein